ncbi:hypothetical protein Peur_056569 [Populus x canadensis]
MFIPRDGIANYICLHILLLKIFKLSSVCLKDCCVAAPILSICALVGVHLTHPLHKV